MAAAASSASLGDEEDDEHEESDVSGGGKVTYWRGAPLVLFYGGGSGDDDSSAPSAPPPVWARVLRQVASNPVVVMTFLGLVTGAGLQGKGLPPVLAKVRSEGFWGSCIYVYLPPSCLHAWANDGFPIPTIHAIP